MGIHKLRGSFEGAEPAEEDFRYCNVLYCSIAASSAVDKVLDEFEDDPILYFEPQKV